MTKRVSSSGDRHTFQKNAYIARCIAEGKKPRPEYIKMMDDNIEKHLRRFDTPESRESNLEYDLLTTDWILEKARTSDTYAQNLYAALCNNTFIKNEIWDILKDKSWGCSWRHAGGILADMQGTGDYMSWYCSGIRGGAFGENEDDWDQKQYVSEGTVTAEIEEDLKRLGWLVVEE